MDIDAYCTGMRVIKDYARQEAEGEKRENPMKTPCYMTFSEYVDAAYKEFLQERGKLPLGQSYFDLLCEARPQIAELVAYNHRFDPFHSDDKLHDFLRVVEALWDILD